MPLAGQDRSRSCDRVEGGWRGVVVVADDHFCRERVVLDNARSRDIYTNFFHLAPMTRASREPTGAFFKKGDLPEGLQKQRRLLQEPIPREVLAKLSAEAAALKLLRLTRPSGCRWFTTISAEAGKSATGPGAPSRRGCTLSPWKHKSRRQTRLRGGFRPYLRSQHRPRRAWPRHTARSWPELCRQPVS